MGAHRCRHLAARSLLHLLHQKLGLQLCISEHLLLLLQPFLLWDDPFQLFLPFFRPRFILCTLR